MTIDPVLVKQATDFHGHWCPGLAIGIRAAEWALKEMGKAPDEEIVAVVETDMCGVDAIQSLTGCTFGKGNLIHKDYGKSAFTFLPAAGRQGCPSGGSTGPTRGGQGDPGETPQENARGGADRRRGEGLA